MLSLSNTTATRSRRRLGAGAARPPLSSSSVARPRRRCLRGPLSGRRRLPPPPRRRCLRRPSRSAAVFRRIEKEPGEGGRKRV
ncbi:hypothetical protein OsJ_24847 [Oryza sativa Japonica Group]|uniref:Uncharacterized protein n=1 Tax=Oryza sativa subsp. japonica TaxID=39947 RepID=B9FY21_ORYSJ|nr:hypothetical protein OsJ_24847 [Oryza sativa Japonica Group]